MLSQAKKPPPPLALKRGLGGSRQVFCHNRLLYQASKIFATITRWIWAQLGVIYFWISATILLHFWKLKKV